MRRFRETLRVLVTLLAALIVPAQFSAPAEAQCGGRWLTSPEQQPPLGLDNTVSGLAVLRNGDLVAGGRFANAGGIPASRIARWNGSAWAPLGSGMNDTVGAFAVYANGDLVAGGAFTTAGGVAANCIASWNGSSWSPLGSGVSGANPNRVFALQVDTPFKGGQILYAGGFFTAAGGAAANNVATWGAGPWFPLGAGVDSFVTALAVLPGFPAGDLVAGGNFISAGGLTANRIARWNGSSWAPLGSGMDGIVRALAVMPNGDLIAGGSFISAGGVTANRIARWNGSSWASLGSGMNGQVNALAVTPNGNLVAGGQFTTAGGVATSRIARWNGAAWASLGDGLNDSVNALAVLPSGELVAGGQFTSAGGVSSLNWARWTDTGIPWISRQPLAQSTSVLGAAAFTVTPASGYDFSGALTFQWRRNGVSISNGTTANGTVVAGADTATLSLTNTSILDSGRYSVVVSNSCGNTTSTGVLLTVGSSACPGDTTGDGLINFADLNAVLSVFGQSVPPGTSGDVTGDGLVNFADLNTVLSRFGAGC